MADLSKELSKELSKDFAYCEDALGRAENAIGNLPSAQPEKRTEKRTETHSCDSIDRQAAIDVIIEDKIDDDSLKIMTAIGGGDKAEALNMTCDRHAKMLMDLPSAQPEPIRINLNEPIKVKLTDWGKEIYYHQYDRTNRIAGREICKPKFPKEDENGYTEFQLWCFMELYGEHMRMTLPNVIEPLEIVYER